MSVTLPDAMRRALELAELGWGRVQPNPMVGAVLLRDNSIVGEGYHQEYGGKHAERLAIAAAGNAARGSTLVTTLEPCNHHGKQPPCVEAIIAAGIVHVIVAMRDPNPEAAGGLERLRSSGVKVEHGLLELQAKHLNAPFLHLLANHSRPFVAVKLAVTMDGRIADRDGDSKWLSGEEAREWVHRERAGFDAIGAGAATVVADDSRLTVRGKVEPRVAPVRVVLDRSNRLTGQERIFVDAEQVPVLVLHPPETTPLVFGRTGVECIAAGSLDEGLQRLREREIRSIQVEGGGRLAGALLSEGLVDRVYQIQSPVFLGGGRAAWYLDGPRLMADAMRWRTADRRVLGDDTLLVLER